MPDVNLLRSTFFQPVSDEWNLTIYAGAGGHDRTVEFNAGCRGGRMEFMPGRADRQDRTGQDARIPITVRSEARGAITAGLMNGIYAGAGGQDRTGRDADTAVPITVRSEARGAITAGGAH